MAGSCGRMAFAEPRRDPSHYFWLMFGDSTNLGDLRVGGRYLWVPAPDSTGWTVIGFYPFD